LTQLFQVGITTGTYQGGGKLYIDEAKLRSAIAANPDQVQKLFTADDGVTATNDGQGIAVRMYNMTQSVMTQINSKAGMTNSINANFLLGRQMNDIDKSVTSMNTKLSALQTRYYNQFNAMDQAISRMNQQMASFQSALGK
jgi:flagellar hook-associated protein 2